MAQLFTRIVHQRADLLVREFHTAAHPPIVATISLHATSRTMAGGGGTVEPLYPRGTNALIWRKQMPDACSLWVSAIYSGWRDAYRTFIEKIYGAVDFNGFDTYQVDHIYNRSLACAQPNGHSLMLRLEAVPRRFNWQHGWAFEQRNTGSTISSGSLKDMHSMTFIQVLKLAGLLAPRSREDTVAIAAIVQYFTAHGWDVAETRESIVTLIDKANRR